MATHELIIITALTGYAVLRQLRTKTVNGPGRFSLALSYGLIAILLGVTLPHTLGAAGFVLVSLAASLLVGCLRGSLTRVYRGLDGQFISRGTTVTVGLFLGLIASKFALGTVAYFVHVPYDASIGEVLLMISVSLAVQAEVVWRRAQALTQANPLISLDA